MFDNPGLVGTDTWSDSVLVALYDAIHAVALTTTGATSLMHEAKVDAVTVPNLSEHLSNAATTAQLSARFGYAAAMKSLNNLLLLGDGETWARQRVDFAGLPEMVRTFLQVAAGAADIPVTRLLGQSPAGLSSTGDHDTRNYYDMIAARQEIELRPQLERLDRLLLASVGVAPGALGFTFRPLWQMDAATKAATALQKAQATGIYAGLGLWPKPVMAGLVAGQLAEDGIYPDAGAAFAVLSGSGRSKPDDSDPHVLPEHPANDWPGQPRSNLGQYAEGKMGGDLPIIQVAHFWEHEKKRRERRARRHKSEREEQERRERSKERPDGSKSNRPTQSERNREPEPGVGSEPQTQVSQDHPIFSHPSIIAPPPSPDFFPDVPPDIGPGPRARAAVRAGPTKDTSREEQRLTNTLGDLFGCSSCHATEPGTLSGNWIADHQRPRAFGASLYLLPHCRTCSNRQGMRVMRYKKERGREDD